MRLLKKESVGENRADSLQAKLCIFVSGAGDHGTKQQEGVSRVVLDLDSPQKLTKALAKRSHWHPCIQLTSLRQSAFKKSEPCQVEAVPMAARSMYLCVLSCSGDP